MAYFMLGAFGLLTMFVYGYYHFTSDNTDSGGFVDYSHSIYDCDVGSVAIIGVRIERSERSSCAYCGSRQEGDFIKCSNCGAPNMGENLFSESYSKGER